jgi:UDP:flavonoid glycosyltransferase YjiC (YdhE family)
MKFVIASSPFAGHLNPLLQIAGLLRGRGHEIIVHTASFLKNRAAGLDARFVPLHGNADFDSRDMAAVFPEHDHLTPGVEQFRYIMEHVFIDRMADQYAGLRRIMRQTHVDGIIADYVFFGTMPLLLGAAPRRPAVIHYGFTCLYLERRDGTPPGPGILPPIDESERARCRAIRSEFDKAVVVPVQQHVDRRLAELGVGSLPMPVLDAIESLPDVHLQPTVPSFEYPLAHIPPALAFVGALPPPATALPLPGWAREVEAARRVVLVTQGTLANTDLGQLIAPTLGALADEPDTLVVATTGGRPVDAIPGPIPGNARLAEYLPFGWLRPRVDLLVTNGGYGTVNMALQAGVPMVVAGQADDKVEIAARVAWSGAGINLATDHPTSDAIQAAVRRVLSEPQFRSRTARFAEEFAQYDTESEITRRVVEACHRNAVTSGVRSSSL